MVAGIGLVSPGTGAATGRGCGRGWTLGEAGTEAPELLTVEVDLDAVTSARKKFPWWRDRRPDLYGSLVTGD